MERLDGPLADLVAAERVEMEALPTSPKEAWAGIAAAWTSPPPAPPPAAPASASAGKGILKIVATLLVGSTVAAGAMAWNAQANDAPPKRVESPVIDPPPAAPTHEPPTPRDGLVLAPPPARPAPPDRAADVSPPRREPAKPKLGLAEELALIDAMRKDVAAKRYAAALERAKTHRASFAPGALAADRMDLEAAARCGRGDLKAGRALAERKAKRWPRAPISDPLRSLCRLDHP
ncbi:MAG: hypothetical protein AAGA54_04575 [Myxococcota bacterium]